MDYDTYVQVIRSEGDCFADAAEAAGLAAPVPSCPGWTVDDLTRHVGSVQRFWTDHVRRRSTEPPDFAVVRAGTDAPDGDARFAWLQDGSREFADALAATPEDTPVWTFGGDGTVRFWARRQAHEIAIHRCDADLANGNLGAIAADVAADGVNEYFELLLLMPAVQAITGTGETVHFHCTDREVEWVAELTPDGVALRPDHAKGDVAVRGSANALFLLVWNRIGPDNPELEVFGDRALLDRWLRLTGI
ncbi:MAG TPA: maleylpyruvate isomerase family mycothiol-dependent enzyme [Acidimicrobiia bacterium]|nr:maleylpyruvate isomerase family mycothiol-dependent enzyme [Acidimicrobiia bacterium]